MNKAKRIKELEERVAQLEQRIEEPEWRFVEHLYPWFKSDYPPRQEPQNTFSWATTIPAYTAEGLKRSLKP